MEENLLLRFSLLRMTPAKFTSSTLQRGPLDPRVFKLSSATGVPFSIHLEPDVSLDTIQKMLHAYPILYQAKHNIAYRNAGYLLTDKNVTVSGFEKCKVSVTKTN